MHPQTESSTTSGSMLLLDLLSIFSGPENDLKLNVRFPRTALFEVWSACV